jgi:hypothetical protein
MDFSACLVNWSWLNTGMITEITGDAMFYEVNKQFVSSAISAKDFHLDLLGSNVISDMRLSAALKFGFLAIAHMTVSRAFCHCWLNQ